MVQCAVPSSVIVLISIRVTDTDVIMQWCGRFVEVKLWEDYLFVLDFIAG